MINDNDEVQWAYLLDPTFELVNTAGKPLTDGYIEVYIHGTRSKYYCASDFDGTLHPFKIPLDSLGANIVLASPAHAYDVYVYNKFGSLVMSRYNVVPATGDGAVIKDVVTITSEDGTVDVTTSDQTNWDLSIKDTVDRIDEHDIVLTELATAIDAINDDLSTKKDKQPALNFNGSATKTVKKITQNANGEMNVEFEDIDLPAEVPNVEITSPNGTIDVQSSTDVQTNTKTFTIDVNKGDVNWINARSAGTDMGIGTGITITGFIKKDGNIDIVPQYNLLPLKNEVPYLVIEELTLKTTAPEVNKCSDVQVHLFNEGISGVHAGDIVAHVRLDNSNAYTQTITIGGILYGGKTGRSRDDYNGGIYASVMNKFTGSVIESTITATVNNISVYELSSIMTQGGGGVSNIVIAREYNGVLDDGYDGVKIRQTDNGNEIIALRKGDSWFSYGQLAPLSAGADKILITDSNGTVHWGVVGTGLEIDNNTLEVQISGEVGDVVETVEKLSDDLDKKITTTYPFAQITSMSDFAQYGVTNTTRMIGQLFAVPIASEIRKDETLLCVNALQNFSGNVSFGIFEYDFEGNGGTGSTYWIADTGTVSIRAGENEFPLKYVLNDAHEMQSSKLYYAVVAVAANAPATGLLLGSSPAYAQNVNANPKYTLIVSNMDQAIDWSTGTLQGAWFQGYNEQYDIPRLFMMLRNGEGSTPIPVTEPFTNISSFTLQHQYRVSDIFSLTPDAEGGVYRKVIPAQDVDIASFRYVDYHNSVPAQTSYPVLLDDTYTPMKAIGDGTWTLGDNDGTKIDGTHRVHEFTFTTPVHLTANTAYWFMVGGNLSGQGSDWLITYQTPSVTNDLLLVKNMDNVNSWIIPNSGEFIASQPGMYLRVSDGTDTWTI